jgi:hypothetical protein
MNTYHYDITNNQWLNEKGDVIEDPRVTRIDTFINQQKVDLDHLEFDDPEFDVVSDRIIEAYRLLAKGESHVVHF